MKIALLTILSFMLVLSTNAQKKQNTIISINGDDTLVIDLENLNGNLDSIIEESLKKFYDVGDERNNKRFEFYFDTIFGDKLDFELDDFFNFKNDFFNFDMDSSRIRFGDIEIDISDGKINQKNNKKIQEDDNYGGFFKMEKEKEREKQTEINRNKGKINFKKKIDKKLDFPEGNWAGFYFGIGGLLNEVNNFTSSEDGQIFAINPLKSFDVHLNPIQKRFAIVKNHIGITTGIGLNWKQYDLINTNIHILGGNSDSLLISSTGLNYEKSTFRTSYLQIPVMVELQTNASKSKKWHLNFGVLGKLKMGNSWMYRTSNSRTVVKDDFLFNPFLISGLITAGYNNINIYTELGLTNLYKNSSDYRIRNFSAGLMLSF